LRELAVDAQRRDRGFTQIKRELVLVVAPELFPFIEGSTDTEVPESMWGVVQAGDGAMHPFRPKAL
jgi:hypothetical protein